MKTLKQHTRGEAVKKLQELLNSQGCQLVVDGIFGTGTEKAVKAFQSSESLVVDGIVGPSTWAALLDKPSENPETEVKTKEKAEVENDKKVEFIPELLRIGDQGEKVKKLQSLLNTQGFQLLVDGAFGQGTEQAVKDFQQKNNLSVDGIVGAATWSGLLGQTSSGQSALEGKFLKPSDIKSFAQEYNLEVAVVKAVKEVESNGSGFLSNGLPRILFEGHVFWRQLEKRGYEPEKMRSGFENVLYPNWVRDFYQGGTEEWDRLRKAISVSSDTKVMKAAYASASYGLFQIMGFHFSSLHYTDVTDFVADMKKNEGVQLHVFGVFLEVNHLIDDLQTHHWADFARRYNGPGYKKNKYDTRLKEAYRKYSA